MTKQNNEIQDIEIIISFSSLFFQDDPRRHQYTHTPLILFLRNKFVNFSLD